MLSNSLGESTTCGDSTGREFWRLCLASSRPRPMHLFSLLILLFILLLINYSHEYNYMLNAPRESLKLEMVLGTPIWLREGVGVEHKVDKKLFFFALSFMWERILGKITRQKQGLQTLCSIMKMPPVTCFTVTFLAQEETHKKQYST